MEFNAFAKTGRSGALKGPVRCRTTQDGLLIRKGDKAQLLVPKGTAAEHLGGDSLRIALSPTPMELRITQFASRQIWLASDLVAFLAGEKPDLVAEEYRLPWSLKTPAVLTIGIPFLTRGGAIPAVIGIGLAHANLKIAQKEDWPAVLRVAVEWCLVLIGYALVFVALAARFARRG